MLHTFIQYLFFLSHLGICVKLSTIEKLHYKINTFSRLFLYLLYLLLINTYEHYYHTHINIGYTCIDNLVLYYCIYYYMIFKIIFACITEDVRNKIGNTDSIRRTIRRARRKNVPEEPKSMQFVLPENWKTTMGGESKEFLIYDNESENRMLIFVTSRTLTILSSSSLWFMDGTFKCSSIFAQLYVIRAEFKDNVFTCVYAFLPNKLTTTYEEMLTNVILASIRNKSSVQPETIIIHFEIGVIDSINLVFNQVKIQGCFFHLCVWRQIQNLGLSKMYKDNEQIAK